DLTHPWPVVLGISGADGQRLLDDSTSVMDMGAWMDDYTFLSGTSQAAPHVSGAIALIWSLAPGASAERVRHALISSATDLGAPGFDLTYGYGLINAFAAAMKLSSRLDSPPSSPERRPRSSP